MSGFLVEETILFLEACVLGAFLGLLFDLFRIFRMTVKSGTIFVFIQDVLYFSIITFVTFMFLLSYNDGTLRMFILVGELMGSVLYFFSLSIIILKSSKLIIKVFKKILSVILSPFVKLFVFLHKKVRILKGKMSNKFKKNKCFNKFSLKNVNRIVYNKIMFKKKKFID